MDRILALTYNPSTSKAGVYYSPTGITGSLQPVLFSLDDAPQRALIGRDTLYACGSGIMRRSLDWGATWTSEPVGNPGDETRAVCEPDPSICYVADEKWVFLSVGGDPFDALDQPIGGVARTFDCCWPSTMEGFVVAIDSSFKSYLHYTDDMGSSWKTSALNLLPNWPSSGVVRRVAYIREDAGVHEMYVLTSHNLLKLRYVPGPVPGITLSLVWDFMPAVEGLFGPGMVPSTGYDGSTDHNTLFDRIHLRGQEVWLGGYAGLRARSLDGSSFTINAPATFHPATPDRLLCIAHSSFMGGALYASSGELGAAAPAYFPGIWRSTDGFGYSNLQGFDNKEQVMDVNARADDPVKGCTLPSACNYESDAVLDDGTCVESVKLTECGGDTVLHTKSGALLALRCRPPAFFFQAGNISLSGGTAQLNITVNGVQVVSFTAGSFAGSAQEQTAAWVGKLVAMINSGGVMRARLVPAGDNPFSPGVAGSVMVTMPEGTPGGQAVNMAWTGMANVDYTALTDNGKQGKVVTLEEYPGTCFRVCGPGNCGLAAPLTLTGQFDNCDSCQPSTPSASTFSCMDCDSQLMVDGIKVSPATRANPICIGVGSTLQYRIRSRFKHREPTVLVPNETGGVLPAGQPAVLSFAGDLTSYFPVGSAVDFLDGTSNQYTVETSGFDQELGLTTVRFIGNYYGGQLEGVQVFSNCASRVRVVTERIDIVEGSEQFTVLEDRTLPSVSDYVEADFDLVLTELAGYRVSVIAEDCAGTRTCTYYFKSCSNLVARELDCHRWQVELMGDPGMNEGLYEVAIHDLQEPSAVIRQVTAAQFPVEVLGNRDTVYRVMVTTPDGTQMGTEIIDLCDLLKCRAGLALSIFCEDPCKAASLTCEEKEARLELSRISLVSSEIERVVYGLRYEWLGIPNMTEQRYADYDNLARMIKSANKISGRCAKCRAKREDCEPCSKS